MTPVDFIVDHLVNIDGLFDKHDNGDEQKPHAPVHLRHSVAQVVTLSEQFKISISRTFSGKEIFQVYNDNIYFSDFDASVFRPPIV